MGMGHGQPGRADQNAAGNEREIGNDPGPHSFLPDARGRFAGQSHHVHHTPIRVGSLESLHGEAIGNRVKNSLKTGRGNGSWASGAANALAVDGSAP